jgi:hypothetical protein
MNCRLFCNKLEIAKSILLIDQESQFNRVIWSGELKFENSVTLLEIEKGCQSNHEFALIDSTGASHKIVVASYAFGKCTAQVYRNGKAPKITNSINE